MNCKSCKNSCDCKERESFEMLDKLQGGIGKCSGYEPYTKTATKISEEATNNFIRLHKENDDLFYKLTGVMHFVDKWLDGDELKQDEVNRAATMREKTLRLIETAKVEAYKEFAERLKAEYTDFDETHEVTLPENINKTIDDVLKKIARS